MFPKESGQTVILLRLVHKLKGIFVFFKGNFKLADNRPRIRSKGN